MVNICKIWYIIFLCIIPSFGFCGIDDHMIYSVENRHTLDGLDALVEVEVINYYAFSEPYVLFNYINEANSFYASEDGALNRIDMQSPSPYWVTVPYLNAFAILRRHAVWVIDARVTNCLDGECKTRLLRIAFPDSPAFDSQEYPAKICVRDENVDRIILGLVWVDENEFKLGFRDKLCFLKDDLDIFRFGKRDNDIDNYGYKEYKDTLITSVNNNISSNDISYCVVRDLNIHKSEPDKNAFVEEDMAKYRGYSLLEKGPLIKALEDALAEEKMLMDSMGIKKPLPNPLVKDRVKELRKKTSKGSPIIGSGQ